MPEREPRTIAKQFLRPYVARGESVEQLARGQMGHYGADYCAQIGGYAYHPVDARGYPTVRLRPQEVAVTEIDREPCLHRFALADLHQEIRAEQEGGSVPQRPHQPRLF